jgi:nucleotide-binding universal stress UspA family protein
MLIGLDGSPDSESATELAFAWSRRTSALVVGIAVVDEPGIRAPAAVPLGAGAFKHAGEEARLAEARQRVEHWLSRFSERAAEASVPSKQLECLGSPGEQIALESQRYDLVILGRETNFHFATQHAPDHTLAEVVTHSPRPVVIVPRIYRAEGPVVIAFDGSVEASRALQDFALLRGGWQDAAELHVVSVAHSGLEAAKVAARAVDYLDFQSAKATAHHLESDGAADTILELAGQLCAGLIVMGSFGKRSLRDILFGSTTRQVLAHTVCPVLVTH